MPYTAMRYTGFGLIGFAFLAFVCWLIHEIFRILDAALTITVLIVVRHHPLSESRSNNRSDLTSI